MRLFGECMLGVDEVKKSTMKYMVASDSIVFTGVL